MPASPKDDGGGLGTRQRIAVWGGAAALMLLPLLAMRVTNEMDWGPGDFMFLSILLGGVGVAYELAARMTGSRAYRAALSVALAAAFILVWMNLAVGIIGSEDNPANLMYGGVLAVGIVGAVIARSRPLGMARAMVATAIVQALVFVIALVGGLGFTGPITVFFAALWLISSWLFRKAVREQNAQGAMP